MRNMSITNNHIGGVQGFWTRDEDASESEKLHLKMPVQKFSAS